MARSDTTLIAIGGGKSHDGIIDRIFSALDDVSDARLAVMTVATNNEDGMRASYNSIFRKRNINHVGMIHISAREDAFKAASLKKIEQADAIYFTGGDQLNVTSLFGGTPLHNLLHEKVNDGVVIAGTSAGAAMMSDSMMIGGQGDTAPRAGGVEVAPGLNLIEGTIIDTHFSERGRHGRLLTAVAHYPQILGIGIDERTAIVVRNNNFRVVGDGTVTVVDGRGMKHSDLVYCREGAPLAMFDLRLHVIAAGHIFDLKARKPKAPARRRAQAAAARA